MLWAKDYYISQYLTHPFSCFAGCDEVGYGSWAGPVWVAAVVVHQRPPQKILSCIQDSKVMSAKNREFLFDFFEQNGQYLSAELEPAFPEEIDAVNVLHATHRAFSSALNRLKPEFTFLDGVRALKNTDIAHDCVIKGDSLITEIALASVLAKVTRDRYMSKISEEYPEFSWEKNKGYGTKKHQEALKYYGPTPHHRLSWAILDKPPPKAL